VEADEVSQQPPPIRSFRPPRRSAEISITFIPFLGGSRKWADAPDCRPRLLTLEMFHQIYIAPSLMPITVESPKGRLVEPITAVVRRFQTSEARVADGMLANRSIFRPIPGSGKSSGHSSRSTASGTPRSRRQEAPALPVVAVRFL
jgi:hypothetical protein